MRKLFDFLYRRRVIAIFIGLEVISAWLIISFNQRPSADFLNSSNALVARTSATSQSISNYFKLEEINEQLILENAMLQSQLSARILSSEQPLDSTAQFLVVGARVINNTFRRSENYLTIDIGKKDNISPGMGVISPSGVVGQVKSVSKNYATVYSVLHPKVMLSSVVKKTNTSCTIQWDQKEYDKASLKYVPRHIDLKVGDTIVTSGFNAVFPPSINIGIVFEVTLQNHMTFHEASVKLGTDFTSLPNVFVIIDEFKTEKDSLEFL